MEVLKERPAALCVLTGYVKDSMHFLDNLSPDQIQLALASEGLTAIIKFPAGRRPPLQDIKGTPNINGNNET